MKSKSIAPDEAALFSLIDDLQKRLSEDTTLLSKPNAITTIQFLSSLKEQRYESSRFETLGSKPAKGEESLSGDRFSGSGFETLGNNQRGDKINGVSFETFSRKNLAENESEAEVRIRRLKVNANEVKKKPAGSHRFSSQEMKEIQAQINGFNDSKPASDERSIAYLEPIVLETQKDTSKDSVAVNPALFRDFRDTMTAQPLGTSAPVDLQSPFSKKKLNLSPSIDKSQSLSSTLRDKSKSKSKSRSRSPSLSLSLRDKPPSLSSLGATPLSLPSPLEDLKLTTFGQPPSTATPPSELLCPLNASTPPLNLPYKIEPLNNVVSPHSVSIDELQNLNLALSRTQLENAHLIEENRQLRDAIASKDLLTLSLQKRISQLETQICNASRTPLLEPKLGQIREKFAFEKYAYIHKGKSSQ